MNFNSNYCHQGPFIVSFKFEDTIKALDNTVGPIVVTASMCVFLGHALNFSCLFSNGTIINVIIHVRFGRCSGQC